MPTQEETKNEIKTYLRHGACVLIIRLERLCRRPDALLGRSDPANALVELSKDFEAKSGHKMNFEFVPAPSLTDAERITRVANAI
jgi:hypothetical protein